MHPRPIQRLACHCSLLVSLSLPLVAPAQNADAYIPKAEPVELDEAESPKPTAKSAPVVAEPEQTVAKPQPVVAKPERTNAVATLMIRQNLYAEALQAFASTQAALLTCETVLSRARKAMEAFHPNVTGRARATAKSINGTTLLQLEVHGDSGEFSLAFAEAVLEEYLTFTSEIQQSQRDSKLDTISEKLLELEAEFNDRSEALATLRQENYVPQIQANVAIQREQVTALLTELQEVTRSENAETKIPGIQKRLNQKVEGLRKLEAILNRESTLSDSVEALRSDLVAGLELIEREDYQSALAGTPVIVIEPPYLTVPRPRPQGTNKGKGAGVK